MHRLLLVLMSAGIIFAAEPLREMKVRVYCSRSQLSSVAPEVLEFYELTDEYFVGAVNENTCEKLMGAGFKVEVLIPDMRAEAIRQCPGEDFGRYHSYQEIMDTFALIATTYPNICHLDTIAVSPTGKYVIALKITQDPNQEHHRPRLEWDGTTHGNENIGTEICLYIVRQLTGNYGSDPLITYLVNTREIWVIPCVNPEGLINRTRGNSRGIDLNRDYGYAWNEESGDSVPWSQPEIQGLRDFFTRHPFVMSMTYHSGTIAVMWPWSYSRIATYDSVAHAQWCQQYGSITGYPAYQISRGLYECQGTSSDFYYGAEGTLGFAAEVSSGQPPPQNQIDTICRVNWNASRQWLIRGGYGIRGSVIDSVTGQPVKRAMVISDPTNWMVYTDTCGWFFKYVLPGTYTLRVRADGYQPKTITGITVPNDTFVVLNITLVPDSTAPITGYRLTTWVCKDPTQAGNTMGLFALGRRDSRALTLTNRGMVVIELSAAVIDGPGTDFTVYSTTSKPCSVFVSRDWNGPWSFCAFGTGNIACDLSSAGITVAYFVRLNDGGQSYDLDAIEGTVVNSPALVYQNHTVVDSPPGGNGDGRLDPGETAGLIFYLRNVGRISASNITGTLRTADVYLTITDSIGFFGNILPDSVRINFTDPFTITAAPETPREHTAPIRLYLAGDNYNDSLLLSLRIGELRVTDPIPDNSEPILYYAYDEVDTFYSEHPQFQWVEIRNQGARLTLSDDQTVQLTLPSTFGPFVYYGQRYNQVSVCSNGWVAPGYTTVTTWSNTSLPNSTMPPLLAANWDDLYPPTGNGVWYYHDTTNHRFIIEWDSVHYFNPRAQWDKFEIILYDTTLAAPDGNSKFIIQYLTANQPGDSATVGIQDHTRSKFIQVLYNGSYHRAASFWIPGHAIKFSTVYQTGVAEMETRTGIRKPIVNRLTNPVRKQVNIHFTLPNPGLVTVSIFDRCGRLVKRSELGNRPAGINSLSLPLTDRQGRLLNTGVYWVKLTTEFGSTTGKITVAK
ncbi:MAG: M14 family zinc carboxypeptidase [candidate division WOR-3 bacterium]